MDLRAADKRARQIAGYKGQGTRDSKRLPDKKGLRFEENVSLFLIGLLGRSK